MKRRGLSALLADSSTPSAVLVGDAPPMREQVMDGPDVIAVLVMRQSPAGVVVDYYSRNADDSMIPPLLREYAATLDGGR